MSTTTPRYVRISDSRTFTIEAQTDKKITVKDEATGDTLSMTPAAFVARYEGTHGIYALTAAALEPYRANIEARVHEHLKKQVTEMLAALEAAGGNATAYAPYPRSSKFPGRLAYTVARESYDFTRKWTVNDEEKNKAVPYTERHGLDAPNYRVPTPALESRLEVTARRIADDIVKGYIWKLTGKQKKLGETAGSEAARDAIGADYQGSLWSGSTMTYTNADGSLDTWSTKIILNVSCLGKIFNQYPTRLAK